MRRCLSFPDFFVFFLSCYIYFFSLIYSCIVFLVRRLLSLSGSDLTSTFRFSSGTGINLLWYRYDIIRYLLRSCLSLSFHSSPRGNRKRSSYDLALSLFTPLDFFCELFVLLVIWTDEERWMTSHSPTHPLWLLTCLGIVPRPKRVVATCATFWLLITVKYDRRDHLFHIV